MDIYKIANEKIMLIKRKTKNSDSGYVNNEILH